jgi:integrin beta 3
VPGATGLQGEKGLDGRDGKDGRDGVDGFGFDDLEVLYDGERSFTWRFTKGERVKDFGPFVMPVPIHRGVFKEGQTYARGDCVTFGGSTFIAKSATAMKPEELGDGARDWMLSTKRGRDGKQGTPGLKGADGRPGKDVAAEGRRWPS